MQRLYDYESLIKKLQSQIEQVEPEIIEKNRIISQYKDNLTQTKTRIDELESTLNNAISKQKSYEPSDKELKKWNWGAFFLSWIWGLHNKLYWQSLVVLVFWIILFLQYTATLFKNFRSKWDFINSFLKSMRDLNPLIIPIIIIIIVLSLGLGFYGIRWAWKAKKWDNWELFQIAQKRWNKAVLWAIPIVLLFGIANYYFA